MPLAIFYNQELSEYDFGPGHPFRGDRYLIFPQFLKDNLPEDNNYRILESEPVTDEDLLLICSREYIDFTREFYRAANLGLNINGQFFNFQSGDNRPIGKPGKLEEAARMVIGQSKKACDLIQEVTYEKVVSIGGGMHHAKSGYGEGFCLYNDVAFCARYLMKEYSLERIMILDTDAHAGNGTMDYFYNEPRVLFVDIHQDPKTLYPGTGFINQIGSGKGTGFTINIPMPVYAGYESYLLAFERIIEPVTREFKPQIIIRNGGSDPHFADGLTNLGLPVKGFRMIGEKVRELSAICKGKVIDLIASGYNEEVLPYGWMALLTGLGDIDMHIDEPVPVPQRFSTDNSLPATEKVIEEVVKQFKDYWSCFK